MTTYHDRRHLAGMHRIDTPTREKDLFGPGKDGFTGGDPLAAKPPTDLSADWFNDVQENIAGAIEGAGIELAKGDSGQLLEAIRRMVNHGLVSTPWIQLGDTKARDVTFAASMFVAVGWPGEIQTSPDGIAWTKRTPDAGFSGNFRGVTYGAGLFVAVGGLGEIQTSRNAETWTRTAAPGVDASCVTYGSDRFIAMGDGGTQASARFL